MAQYKSHAHIECMINGHRVTGWSDDDPPYEIEDDPDSNVVKIGADGGKYGMSNPAFGGTLTLKVSPTSPTCQWAIQQNQERKNRQKDKQAERIYAGTLSDPVQGVDYRFEGGVIDVFPSMNVGNQTYEFSINFDEVISNVDGGMFHAPLTSDAAG